MGIFFKKRPKKGMPLSTTGLADGLSDMDEALTKMDIAGGYIDWNNKIPLIVPGGYATTPTAPPAGLAASWQLVGVLTRASTSDPWEISMRWVWCTSEVGTDQETVPHQCPETYE
jgi:hypothetical protein